MSASTGFVGRLLMRAVERHGNQVSLHSFGQGANLAIKSQGARAAERGCEEGMWQ